MTDWTKSIALMRELWPSWKVTGAQLTAWQEMFGKNNGEWFREALQIVYGRYSSQDPKPKWVAQAFKEVRAGKMGIPMTESEAAEQSMSNRMENIQVECQIAEASRSRIRSEVEGWTEDTRARLMAAAAEQHPSLRKFIENAEPGSVEKWSSLVIGAVYMASRDEAEA